MSIISGSATSYTRESNPGIGQAAVAAGGSALGALVGGLFQNKANKKNEELMREGWARDDTRYQRTVKDLKAAGINPLLATNMSPGQSQPVKVESVGREAGGHIAGAAQNAVSAYSAQTQRMMAQADSNLREQQALHTKQMFDILKQYGPRSEEARIGLQEQQTAESGARSGLVSAQIGETGVRTQAAQKALDNYDDVVLAPAKSGVNLNNARIQNIQADTWIKVVEEKLAQIHYNLQPLYKQQLEEDIRRTTAEANFTEAQAKEFVLALEQAIANNKFGPSVRQNQVYQDIKGITHDVLDTFGKATGAIGNLWRSSTSESTFTGKTESMQRPFPTPPRGRIGF